MKKIGIVGTGIMGSGMAQNYLKAGHTLSVWNRSQDKAENLVKLGAKFLQSTKRWLGR
jgi:3-hydroxyisobutyrate dehydrogenase